MRGLVLRTQLPQNVGCWVLRLAQNAYFCLISSFFLGVVKPSKGKGLEAMVKGPVSVETETGKQKNQQWADGFLVVGSCSLFCLGGVF